MRVLSIDPAIRNTGFAVLDGDHREAVALEYGTLSLPQKLPQRLRCSQKLKLSL